MTGRLKKKFLIIAITGFVILYLSGCQSLWYLFLDCVVDIAPDRYTFEKSNQKISIPLFTSHPLEVTNKSLQYAIVMIHGAGLNAGKSFETGKQIVHGLGAPIDKFMVMAPQFLEGIYPDEKGLLSWDQTWRSGGVSISEKANGALPGVNSYEVLDRLLYYVSEKNPTIHSAILFGHSAGGQFVARYAATNNIHERLKNQGVSVHYISANPSSYLYLDASRYQLAPNGDILKLPMEELGDCRDYNHYKYGMDDLFGYAEPLSKQEIRSRLITRPVIFLLGSEDTKQGWSLDKSCAAQAQGNNRFERGLLYKHHLKSFINAPKALEHDWMIIPGVGHDANEMFTHRTVIHRLRTLTN